MPDGRDRDRETVRRALRAGGAGAVVAALGLLLALPPAPAVVGAVTVGALVSSGWLLLAAALDVLAGQRPGTRRWAWTALAVGLALLGPLLFVGTLVEGAR